MPGYIKLYRDLTNNPIWQKKPFSPGQAWVDILFRCNHVCKRVMGYGSLEWVLRGQFISSNYKLAEAWGWSESSVRQFIKMLVNDEMLTVLSTRHYSLFEVTKYCVFQSIEESEFEGISNAQKTHRKRTSHAQKTLNNNDNNDNNEKKVNTYTSPLQNAIEDFKEFRKKINAKMTDKAFQLFTDKLNKLASDDETKIAIINQSIMNGWKGVFPLKEEKQEKPPGKFKAPQAANFEQRQYPDEYFEKLYKDV